MDDTQTPEAPLAIKGYRPLTAAQVELMNGAKEWGTEIGEFIAVLRDDPEIDQRWLAIAQTELQKGIMFLCRAIARPDSF